MGFETVKHIQYLVQVMVLSDLVQVPGHGRYRHHQIKSSKLTHPSRSVVKILVVVLLRGIQFSCQINLRQYSDIHGVDTLLRRLQYPYSSVPNYSLSVLVVCLAYFFAEDMQRISVIGQGSTVTV